MGLVVVLHGVEGEHQLPGVAEGAQAGVHAEHEAVLGGPVQEVHQALGEAGEILAVGEGPGRPAHLPFLPVGEDEVHVGGEVELAPAQLAHAQDHQGQGIAGGVHRLPQFARLPGGQARQAQVDGGLGEGGQLAQGLDLLRAPGHFPPGDAHHLPAPVAAQHTPQLGLVAGRLHQGCQGAGVEIVRPVFVQIAPPQEVGEEGRLGDAGTGDEFAGGEGAG